MINEIDLDFIQKTTIQPNITLDGYRPQKTMQLNSQYKGFSNYNCNCDCHGDCDGAFDCRGRDCDCNCDCDCDCNCNCDCNYYDCADLNPYDLNDGDYEAWIDSYDD